MTSQINGGRLHLLAFFFIVAVMIRTYPNCESEWQGGCDNEKDFSTPISNLAGERLGFRGLCRTMTGAQPYKGIVENWLKDDKASGRNSATPHL